MSLAKMSSREVLNDVHRSGLVEKRNMGKRSVISHDNCLKPLPIYQNVLYKYDSL